MLIDCNTCEMQHTSACDDCIVTVLLNELGPTAGERRRITMQEPEIEALDNLADLGLVPHLKLVPKGRTDPRAS